ncbi:MAG: HEAT repeat domain-containing protein [Planctomycetota bacterium]
MQAIPAVRFFLVSLIWVSVLVVAPCPAQEQPGLDELLKRLKDEDPKARLRAARLLSEQTDPKALPALFDALQDPYTRLWAVHGIYKHNNKEAAPELIKALTHRNPEARWRAVSILGNIGDASVAPQVHPLLRDEDPKVRSWAAWAMGQFKHKEAGPDLLKAVGDTDPDTAAAAAAALAPMESPEAVPVLVNALESPHAKVRRSAAYSLGFYPTDASAQALQAALDRDDSGLRQSAIIALIRFGDKGLPGVQRILDKNDESLNIDLSIVCSQLLGPVSVNESAAPALELIAEKGPDDVHTSARAVLWRLHRRPGPPLPPDRASASKTPPDIQKLIEDALSDDDDRSTAAEDQLARIGAPAVPAIVERMQKDAARNENAEDIEDATAAFDLRSILVRIGSPACPALIKALVDPYSAIRSEAAEALGEIGDPSAVQPLCDALSDPLAEELGAGGLHYACVEALKNIGDPSAAPTLVSVLEARRHEDPWLAGEIATALGEIGHRSAIPTLLVMLEGDRDQQNVAPEGKAAEEVWDDEDETERSAAAKALGMLADPATLPALEDALRGAKGKLKRDIEKAILRIKTLNE